MFSLLGHRIKYCMYSSGHKQVYVLDYAVAVVLYNLKRNVHSNRRAVQLPCLI